MFKKLNSGKFDEQYLGEPNVVAPFTSITNRAKIEANCKVVGPVERIVFNSLVPVINEVGPDSEPVFTNDKEDSRVRFIGVDWVSQFDNNAQFLFNNTLGVSTEITFYGTGLNTLSFINESERGYQVKLNGVSQPNVSVIGSNILASRYTKTNVITNIVKGLPLDWYTVELTSHIEDALFYGCEILNESSELSVLSGSVYKNGYEYILENNLTLPFKPASYVGTNGARVLTYINPSNGEVEQSFTPVGTPAYIGASDHSNEAIKRKINYREFGRNRADDFSTLSGATSNRAFTLDDNETTLIGKNVQGNSSGIDLMDASSFMTITFKGTGLDVYYYANDNISIGKVFVDGVDVGNYIRNGRVKICSGLPYGTHTVKFDNSIAIGGVGVIEEFIIYQTKKPSVPKECFILSDYNVMADFIPFSSSALTALGVGTVRKASLRELTMLDGSTAWGISGPTPLPDNSVSGWQVSTGGTGSIAKISFYGEGFELRGDNGPGWGSATVELDDTLITLANFPNLVHSVQGADIPYNDTTAVYDSDSAGVVRGAGLSISGLPLGFHTLKLTNISAEALTIDAIDIITPISSFNTSNGNNSLIDMREQIVEEISTSLLFDSSAKKIRNSKNIAQLVNVATGVNLVYFDFPYGDNKFMAFATSTGNEGSITTRTANYVAVTSGNSGGTLTDSTSHSLMFMGKTQKDIFKD